MTQLLRWLFLKFYSDLHDNLVIGILEIDSVLPLCCSYLCFQFGGAVQVTTSFIGDHAYCTRPRESCGSNLPRFFAHFNHFRIPRILATFPALFVKNKAKHRN